MEIPDQFSTEINKLEFLLRTPPDSADYDKRTIGGSTSWVRLHEPPEVRTPTTVLN
jgi:hypothetical protein